MKKILFVFLVAKVGFSTPIDLKIGVRPQGMGGAFVSIADDANALYWNPAGLSKISFAEVSFMHVNPFGAESTYIDYVSLTEPFGRSSGLGIGLLYKSAILEQEQTKSRMADSEFIIGGASSIGNAVMLGGNVKFLSLSTKIDKGKGMSFDIGLLYNGDFPIKDCSMGFMYRNLASQIKNESFSKEIRAGISKRFGDRLILSVDWSIKRDVNKKENDIRRWHTGVEISPFKNIILRGGYDNGDIALGCGILFKGYQCDYSFVSEREYELPNTHRFGFGIRF